MKIWLPVSLFLMSVSAVAGARTDDDPWRLGVVSTATISARESAFGVVAECEKRFPELQDPGKKVRAAWSERNKDAAEKFDLLATKIKARIQVKSPVIDVDALLRESNQASQKIITELVAQIIGGALGSAPSPQQLNACKAIFASIQQGKMDILTLQTTARPVLQEDESRDFLQSYKGLTYQDGGDKFRASGTWIGLPFPLNESTLTADSAEMKMHIADKTMVAFGDKIPPFMSTSDETLSIEVWNAEVIRTEVKRAGKSQRFFQYVINRQTKEVNMVFTGESPKTHVLGDVGQQINEAKAKYD